MSIQAASKVATASQNLPPADSRERFKDSEREFPSPFMGRDGAYKVWSQAPDTAPHESEVRI
jgi:hypothetical protein